MKHSVFTIHDSKAQAFLQPFFMQNESLAIRAISECISDENHKFHMHAEDFTLFKLGDFDDQTAQFDNLPAPQSLTPLITLKHTLAAPNLPPVEAEQAA